MRRLAPLLLLLLHLLAACEETRTIRIGFGASARAPLALRCEDDSGTRIVRRAFDAPTSTLRFSLLVDFIGLGGGVPSCRPGDIFSYCEEHGCAPLFSPQRQCYPLERMVLYNDDRGPQLVADMIRTLTEQRTLITADAPHEPVIIRATAVAASCEELAGATPPAQGDLIGCATSCPLQLDGIDGEVVLQLDANSVRCEASVVQCATAAFGP